MPRPSRVQPFKKQNDPSTAARRAALTVLNNVEQTGKTLDRIIFEQDVLLNAMSPADRGLFNTLVYGVLRWRKRLDFFIARFSKTRLEKIDPGILNILRLGLYQILHLTRIPVSAAVNTSVELSKSAAPRWVVRFVNAVLRKAASKHQTVSFPDLSDNPVETLSIEKSFPAWMVQRWLERYGLQKTIRLCDASNELAPLTLRTNTLKVDRERLLLSVKNCAREVHPTRFAPGGIALWHPNRTVMDLPGFKRGWFQVQDEAAQLVSCLLDAQPGERVLDACAGIGGKTGHIAQMMNNRGEIVALDNNAGRLQQLDAQMKRLGVSIVQALCADIGRMPFNKKPDLFDRILVDAPCSGMGVFRRNPDTKWRLRKVTLEKNQNRQVYFLDQMAALVRPAGTLIYAVCSMEPEENEKVVEIFFPDTVTTLKSVRHRLSRSIGRRA